jgi:hypothetical protein
MGFFSKLLGAAIVVGLGFVTGGAAFTWGAFFQRLAINTVLSFALSALTPKPAGRELQDNKTTNRNPIASRKIVYGQTRVGGSIVFLESTGTDNKYLHLVITLATHEIESVEKVYFNDEVVWDSGSYQDGWGSHCEITPHLGSTSQSADSNLVSRITDWTTDHKLSGVAYLYVRLTYDQDKFAMGIPNVSALVKGRKVWTGSTTEYSNNPAWCLRDYLLDSDYGMAVQAYEINETSFATAAGVCDELVATSNSDTQKRYTMDGVVDLANSRSQIIEDMLTSMGGVFSYSGGEFNIHASKYYAPAYSFDESDMTGSISIQTKQSRRDLYNGVKGVFNSEDDNYVAMDYPPVISDSYVLEDGDPSYLDINLPYTTNPIRAQRLAKLILLQGRQQISATIPLNMKSLQVKAGDFISISNSRLGWSNKVFRVTNYELSIDNSGIIGTNLSVVETSSAIYDWSTDDETPFVAGKTTNLPTFYDVYAPTGLSLSASSMLQEDGTVQSYIDIEWTAADAFATHYEIQYKYGANAYSSLLTANTEYRLENVVAGAEYTIRVRAINRLGARSDFATQTTDGTGDATAPSPPTNLSATGALNSVLLSWTNPSDSDLDIIEIYEGTSTIQANAVLVGTTKSNSYIRGGLSNGVTRYYWIKAADYTGNKSDFNASEGVSATTTIPDLIDETQFIGRIEQVTSLTTGLTADDAGKVELLTTDTPPTLYKWSGTEWQTGVVIADDVGEILAQHIAVTELSAITANVGTLSAGTLQGLNSNLSIDLDNETFNVKSASSGERLEISNDVIKVYDASGNLRVKLGDLS